MSKYFVKTGILITLIVLVSACGPAAPTATPMPTATSVPPTQTPAPEEPTEPEPPAPTETATLAPIETATPAPTESVPASSIQVEKITFQSEHFDLVGDLQVPSAEGEYPAVIMVHGDGSIDRYDSGKYHPIMERFLSAGYAVFSWDKPGTGASRGKLADDATKLSQRAAILISAVEFLKEHPAIDPERIGAWGISQGGYVIPLALRMTDDIAFMIVVSGPAMDGIDQTAYLLGQQLVCQGYSKEEGKLAQQSLSRLPKATSYQEYRECMQTLIQFPSLNYKDEHITPEDEWAPWDLSVGALFNPIEVIEQTTIPVLAFFGEKDTQVDPFQGAQAYEEALQKAGNQNYRVELIPGVAHCLDFAETGCMDEYRRRIYAPEYLELMEEWLVQLLATPTNADEASLSTETNIPSTTATDPKIPVFSKSNQTLGNTRSFGLAIGDIDLDNDQDIVFANYIGSSRIWTNDGSGTFTESGQTFDVSECHDVGMADFNGDGYPDIFLLGHASPSKVYFNDGSGGFADSQQNIGIGTEYPGMIVLGDVDNDDDIDAFISHYEIPNRLWINDGNGFFTKSDREFGGDGNPGHMELADFNGDSFPDLFLCMTDSPDRVLLNDGEGNFTDTGQALGSSIGNDNTRSKDIDGDGDNDVVVANNEEGIVIWLNQDNTGTFVEAGDYFGDNVSLGFELFDADLDGDFDLITIHHDSGTMLWINDGEGHFTSLGAAFGPERVFRIGSEDLDDDGDIDIVFGQLEGTGGNAIYVNLCK